MILSNNKPGIKTEIKVPVPLTMRCMSLEKLPPLHPMSQEKTPESMPFANASAAITNGPTQLHRDLAIPV